MIAYRRETILWSLLTLGAFALLPWERVGKAFLALSWPQTGLGQIAQPLVPGPGGPRRFPGDPPGDPGKRQPEGRPSDPRPGHAGHAGRSLPVVHDRPRLRPGCHDQPVRPPHAGRDRPGPGGTHQGRGVRRRRHPVGGRAGHPLHPVSPLDHAAGQHRDPGAPHGRGPAAIPALPHLLAPPPPGTPPRSHSMGDRCGRRGRECSRSPCPGGSHGRLPPACGGVSASEPAQVS